MTPGADLVEDLAVAAGEQRVAVHDHVARCRAGPHGGEDRELGGQRLDRRRVLRDARFRNLLVHSYAEVDDERVVNILMTKLKDLDRLRAALAATAPE
ncbi:MAG: HepT-like ribonuclease domain-containing protein [Egibacteraceae bacterium]